MNSMGRPRTPPLAFISLANSSHARLACTPYWAFPPERAAGRPILIGSAAEARRTYAGNPRLSPAALTRPAVTNSRRVVFMIAPPVEFADLGKSAPSVSFQRRAVRALVVT